MSCNKSPQTVFFTLCTICAVLLTGASGEGSFWRENGKTQYTVYNIIYTITYIYILYLFSFFLYFICNVSWMGEGEASKRQFRYTHHFCPLNALLYISWSKKSGILKLDEINLFIIIIYLLIYEPLFDTLYVSILYIINIECR